MEPWQREHITKNLPDLSKLTDFNTYVKDYLVKYNVLSTEEVEELNAVQRTEARKTANIRFYHILETRLFAYEILIKALEEFNQTEAVQILRMKNKKLILKTYEKDFDQEQFRRSPVSSPFRQVSSFLNPLKSSITIPSPNTATSLAPKQKSVENREINLFPGLALKPQPSTSQNSSADSETSSIFNLPLETTEQILTRSAPLPRDYVAKVPPVFHQPKIQYSESEKLGIGSGGTIVCKGTFGQRVVAVKILTDLKDKSEAKNEIKSLLQCDNHINIIRYYHSEKTPNGFRIALELCEKHTLADWVEKPDCLKINIEPLDVLRQASQGLGFLHQPNINIIHRDLKPSNILFSIQGNEAVVKLSDFGISRNIRQGDTKRTCTSFGGTFGWTAPEMLEAESALSRSRSRQSQPTITEHKMTNKIDIFSLGCIYYFVLTDGEHPFGDEDDLKNYNIKKGRTQLKDEYDSLRLQCNLALVKSMIARYPTYRPDIRYILAHPMFWDHKKMIDFIDDVSNFVTKPIPSNQTLCENCVADFEDNYFSKISNGSPDGWFGSLDSTLKPIFVERYQEDDKHKAIELVRKIRNFKHHYNEKSYVVIKNHIGELPDAFMIFWLKMFPTLINEMRDAFDDLKARESFKCYFY